MALAFVAAAAAEEDFNVQTGGKPEGAMESIGI